IVRFNGMGYNGYIQPLTGIATESGNLPHKKIIHMVSKDFLANRTPKNHSSKFIARDTSYVDEIVVKNTTKNALKIAEELELESLGFPVFGTGFYRMTLEQSISIMANTITQHLKTKTSLNKVGIIISGVYRYNTAIKILNSKLS
ncbi:MAG: macro domain-containing protein, partial [Nanoarchaeota archaeon]|nr:macro domain-containing protein [Nanoarchaeota archaeon]